MFREALFDMGEMDTEWSSSESEYDDEGDKQSEDELELPPPPPEKAEITNKKVNLNKLNLHGTVSMNDLDALLDIPCTDPIKEEEELPPLNNKRPPRLPAHAPAARPISAPCPSALSKCHSDFFHDKSHSTTTSPTDTPATSPPMSPIPSPPQSVFAAQSLNFAQFKSSITKNHKMSSMTNTLSKKLSGTFDKKRIRSTKSDGPSGITRDMIGAPSNFVHVSHMGSDDSSPSVPGLPADMSGIKEKSNDDEQKDNNKKITNDAEKHTSNSNNNTFERRKKLPPPPPKRHSIVPTNEPSFTPQNAFTTPPTRPANAPKRTPSKIQRPPPLQNTPPAPPKKTHTRASSSMAALNNISGTIKPVPTPPKKTIARVNSAMAAKSTVTTPPPPKHTLTRASSSTAALNNINGTVKPGPPPRTGKPPPPVRTGKPAPPQRNAGPPAPPTRSRATKPTPNYVRTVNVPLCGMLQKKSGGKKTRVKFDTRWFELTDKYLHYYIKA
eukprot:Pgem_evm2s16032